MRTNRKAASLTKPFNQRQERAAAQQMAKITGDGSGEGSGPLTAFSGWNMRPEDCSLGRRTQPRSRPSARSAPPQAGVRAWSALACGLSAKIGPRRWSRRAAAMAGRERYKMTTGVKHWSGAGAFGQTRAKNCLAPPTGFAQTVLTVGITGLLADMAIFPMPISLN
jgi:hypothetical protein